MSNEEYDLTLETLKKALKIVKESLESLSLDGNEICIFYERTNTFLRFDRFDKIKPLELTLKNNTRI